MRSPTHFAAIGVAMFIACAGSASAQRVCQPGDTECYNSRMHSQREQTLRLQNGEGHRHEGMSGARNSSWEQYRQEETHRRSSPVCDVNPIVTGEGTRVVPTC